MCQPIVTFLVVVLYGEIAASHADPRMMLMGLAPLALIAAETVWHFMDTLKEQV